MTRNNKKANKRVNRGGATIGRELMPSISTRNTIRNTFRFQFLTDSDTDKSYFAITDRDIMLAAGSVGVTSTTVRSMFTACKVHRVSLWSTCVQNTGTTPKLYPNSVELEWTSTNITNSGSNLVTSDTTISPSLPAFISCVPPAGSVASFWNGDNDNTSLFTIAVGQTAIVDIDVTLVLSTGMTAQATRNVTGATVGNIYASYLGTSLFSPVGIRNPIS